MGMYLFNVPLPGSWYISQVWRGVCFEGMACDSHASEILLCALGAAILAYNNRLASSSPEKPNRPVVTSHESPELDGCDRRNSEVPASCDTPNSDAETIL